MSGVGAWRDNGSARGVTVNRRVQRPAGAADGCLRLTNDGGQRVAQRPWADSHCLMSSRKYFTRVFLNSWVENSAMWFAMPVRLAGGRARGGGETVLKR